MSGEDDSQNPLLSSSQIELLRANLEDYREVFYEPKFGTNLVSDTFWKSLVEKVLLSSSYISSVDDILTDIAFEDVALADDIYSLIEEVKQA